MKKFLKYFLISAGAISVLAVISGLIIFLIYKDEIPGIITAELNKNLNSEVKVRETTFSVFRNFPDASVEFEDVAISSSKNFSVSHFEKVNSKEFLKAGKVSLQFNIFNLFQKKYMINKISVSDGIINMLIDKNGKDNFHFWKQSNEADSSNMQLKLKQFTFSNVKFNFIDIANGTYIACRTEKYKVSGDFSSKSYTMLTQGEIFADKIKIYNSEFIRTEQTSVELELGINNNLLSIIEGKLAIDELQLQVTGAISLEGKMKSNLIVKGENLEIASLLSLLPEKYNDYSKEYSSSGNFYFQAKINGELSDANNISVSSEFGIKNGSISRDKSDIELTGIYAEGRYINKNISSSTASELSLRELKFKMGSGKFEGKCEIQNFLSPEIKLTASAELNLGDLQNILRFDTIEKLGGNMTMNISYSGKIENISNLKATDFINSKSSGNIAIEKAAFQLKQSTYDISDFSGEFSFSNNDIEIAKSKLIINSNDFNITGKLRNIFSYIFLKNQAIEIEGNISSANLNVNKLLTESSGQQTVLILPSNLIINSTIKADNFTFSSFNAKNLSCDISYNNKKLSTENLSMNALNGTIQMTNAINQDSNGKIYVNSKVSLGKLDIEKLFHTFGNFGQNYISSSNLKGSISADISFSSEWDSTLKCNPKSIVSVASINIQNGELQNFKTLEELALFIDLAELKNIKFSDMKNEIVIKDEKITIPQMDINTSALNIKLSGEQYFNGNLDYRVKVLLSDLLFRKAGKNKKENNEFGTIEEEDKSKTSLHLKIYGNTDKFNITYDSKKAREEIKDAVKEEQKNIKSILNEEFGLFKSDTSVASYKKKKEEEEKLKKKKKVKVKWDENEEEEKDRSDEK